MAGNSAYIPGQTIFDICRNPSSAEMEPSCATWVLSLQYMVSRSVPRAHIMVVLHLPNFASALALSVPDLDGDNMAHTPLTRP